MLETLPNSIIELQVLLEAKEFTPREALLWQQERLQSQAKGNAAVLECLDIDFNDDVLDSWDPFKPLSGVGLAHKDIFNLNSRAPGLGLGLTQAAPGIELAYPLSCLHQSGARQLATLNMAPLAFGSTSSNSYLGRCVNPLNSNAVVGGSSSGSAVAVANGWVYGSLGTDTAGSIRIPAASCGVVGLKTSHGLVSSQGCAPLAPALDSVGVLARNFTDARAVLLSALSPKLTQALEEKNQPLQAQSARLRCFIPDHLDAEVSSAILGFCKTLDHVSITHDLPQFQILSQHAEVVMLAQVAQTHGCAFSSKPPPFNALGRYPDTLPSALAESALAGLAIPQSWLEELLTRRLKSLQTFLATAFEGVDFLILPALATALPLVHEVELGAAGFEAQKLLGLHRYMGFVNYLGLPALVAPVATDRRGLPVSVQVLAKPDQDLNLLDWAHHQWSKVLGWPGASVPAAVSPDPLAFSSVLS